MLRLRNQILLIALLPAALLTLTIGSYLLATRIADMRESQQEYGENIVRHLAPASEYAVFSGNQQALDRLSQNLVAEPSVSQLRILDADGVVISEALSDAQTDSSSLFSRLYPVAEEDLQFSAPIEIGDEPGGEFESLFADQPGEGLPGDERIIGQVELQLSPLPLMERQTEVLGRGLVMILGGLFIVWLMAVQAGLKMVRPLNQVVDAITRFRQGEQDARVPLNSRGEAGLLEKGFNELADEVQTAHQYLESQVEKATAELRETLEAVEIKNVELDLARKRAEASNQIKSEFLANISHEIRTPMNAIFGYTQLLGRTQLKANQKEYLGTIQRSAESLLALLEDVLNLSRIEAGRVEVEETICQPAELIEDTMAMMAPGIFHKGLELIWAPLHRLPAEILVDKVKLRQILSNLLSNAAKFTDEGYVKVNAQLEINQDSHSWLIIDVIDTGIGIHKDDTWKLFQAFSQLDSSSARRHQGAGLGLVICEQLTKLLGGQINVESEPGLGSHFTIQLPVKVLTPERGLPLANHSLVLFSPEREMAEALSRRLRAWGAEVNHIDEEQKIRAAGTGGNLIIIEISQGMLEQGERLESIQAQLPNDARVLVLISSLDRDILQRIESWLHQPALPRTISSKQLLETLHEYLNEPQSLTPTSVRHATQQSLFGLNVMVVEDNRINRHLTREFLEVAGAVVRTAVDGPDALEQLNNWKPDLILMDIQLPSMDGLETTLALRERYGFSNTPVLALTASAGEGERKRCQKAGLDDVLVKPVPAETLVERIRRALRLRRPSHFANGSSTDQSPSHGGKVSNSPPQPMGRENGGNLKPEIAAMVLDDLPKQSDKARQYLSSEDWDHLDAEVHRMRGTAAFCGFNALAECCESIRACIDQGSDPVSLSRKIQQMQKEVDAVLKDIQYQLESGRDR
ncbi:two-component system sensor histidine kinase BarA [Natronospira proteinivora]|uniref:histidine kinase n=1 Tax=Natronospira proteinivora TaxID=1807133 RepID=A0ABT1G9R6_9GAMM|nr:response regulator [Natronospira proteinivora]MCP1726682.1 two-component system sensor histidine kinase BarA [Natronospira proteinivora]